MRSSANRAAPALGLRHAARASWIPISPRAGSGGGPALTAAAKLISSYPLIRARLPLTGRTCGRRGGFAAASGCPSRRALIVPWRSARVASRQAWRTWQRASLETGHRRAGRRARRSRTRSARPERARTALLIWRNGCQVSSVHAPLVAAVGGLVEVCSGGEASAKFSTSVSLICGGWLPQVPGSVAGERVSRSGRGLVRAAHSSAARASGLRGPTPPHPSGARAVSLGYGAVAAAQRKQASSRAQATVITLPGFRRSRIRRWSR